MKRIFLCFVLSALLVALPSCAQKESAPADTVRGSFNYDLSEYVEIGEWRGIEAAFDDPETVTDKEIDRAIEQILLASCEFREKSGEAQRFDRVTFSLSLQAEGDDEPLSFDTYQLVIGDETLDELSAALAAVLEGKRVGDEASVEYTYPDRDDSYAMRGKKVVAAAKITGLESAVMKTLDDQVVSQISGCRTVADFRDQIREELKEYKRSLRRNAVWIRFLETVTVKAYPEKELSEALQRCHEYWQGLAAAEGVSVQDYVLTHYGMTPEQYEQDALERAKELVKNDMVMAQLARVMQIGLTEEEYRVGLEEYTAGQGGFDSPDLFEQSYGKEYIREHLIWDKAVDLMAENAVRITE